MLKFGVNIPGSGVVDVEIPDETLKIITEALQPTASEIGTLLAILPAAVNHLLTPLQLKIENSKYIREKQKAMHEKMLEQFRAIPPSVLIEPRLPFLLSAQDALPHVLTNGRLQEMFAILFANALHKDKAVFASEIFMEMLKTMTHEDTLLIMEGQYLEKPCPIIRIFECEVLGTEDEEMKAAGMPEFYSAPHKIPVFSHYALLLSNLFEDERTICFSIHNLHRHELINVDYYERILHADDYRVLYTQLINSSFYINCKQSAQNKGVNLCLTRGYTSPTDLGRSFFNACCKSLTDAEVSML